MTCNSQVTSCYVWTIASIAAHPTVRPSRREGGSLELVCVACLFTMKLHAHQIGPAAMPDLCCLPNARPGHNNLYICFIAEDVHPAQGGFP